MIFYSPQNRISSLTPSLLIRARGGDGATQLFYDTFTGADGTALTSHTPDVDAVGGGWVKRTIASGAGVTATIQSNKARINGTGGQVACWVANVNDADVTITCIVTFEATSGPGITLRSNNSDGASNNQWSILLYLNKINIYQWDGSAYTLRASTAFPLTPATPYTLVVTSSGNNITAAVGATSASYSSASYNTNTRHGIIDASGVAVQPLFENFEVLS